MTVKRGGCMTRREFMAEAGAAVLAGAYARGETVERRKPNLIYLFSDEHRYQSMSFTEMPEVKTLHMAALAEQGVSFTHCISNYPVCSPHRAMLMTGRWPYQQGVIDNDITLDAGHPTLAKAFKEAGYHTAYVGKWHLGGTRAESYGFDFSLIWTGTNTHWDASEYHPKDAPPVRPKGYNATLMTDQTIEYVRKRAVDPTPFLLMVSWNPPHSSFTDPPESKRALYPEGFLPWRPNVDLGKVAQSELAKQIWDQNSWPYYQGYHAHVSAIDDELGRLMAALDELGIAENTILVYSSDHGSMLGSHGLGSKRQPYEESIRVPFLARAPGLIPAGRRLDPLFGTIDIMPTLCGLAGVCIPEGCVGLDFAPALRGERGPEPESQFLMHISKKNASQGENHPAPIFRGIRTKRYTYAAYPGQPWCLFDNQEDPYQQKNLVDDPAHAPLRKELETTLRDWLQKADDPFQM